MDSNNSSHYISRNIETTANDIHHFANMYMLILTIQIIGSSCLLGLLLLINTLIIKYTRRVNNTDAYVTLSA